MAEPFLLDPKDRRYLDGILPGKDESACWHLLIAGPVSAVIAWLLWGLADMDYTWCRLRREGVDAVATVSSCKEYADDSGGSTYEVEYRYRAEGEGPALTGTADLDREASVGQELAVRYLPSDPGVSNAREVLYAGAFRAFLRYAGLAIAAPFAAVFGFAALVSPFAFLQALREDRLERGGRILIGEILDCRAVRKKPLVLRIRYRFVTPEGRRIERTVTLPRGDLEEAPLPPPGAAIAVLYRSRWTFRPL